MIFRPSALLTLQVRFDTRPGSPAAQRLDESVTRPEGAATPDRAAAGRTDAPATLEAIDRAERALNRRRAELPPAEYAELREDLREQRERVLRAQTSAPGDPPAAFEADGDRVVLTGILPVSFEIQRNGLTTADTATIELDFKDAPFDPRSIRSAAVELVFGVIGADDHARGARGELRPDGTLPSVPERQGEGATPPGLSRFVGIVDEWGGTLDGSTSDTVSLTCRDMTALLLDQQIPKGAGVNLALPLDRAVREFLDLFPPCRGFDVVYGVEGETPITPVDALPPSRRTAGRRARRAQRVEKMAVWDYLSDLAVSLGLVATLEDYTIRFVQPRTFYASRSASRRMVYGRNLERFDFRRKIGGVKTPTIEVRALDPVLGRTRWARHPVRDGQPKSGVYPDRPPRPTRAETVPPSSTGAEDKIQTFTLSGFADPTTLERAAESIWQQIGRQEIEIEIETADVASYERDPSEADLLALRAGDAVEVLIASQDANDVREALISAGILEGLSVEARARYLARIGYDEDVARRIAEFQEDANALTVYRTNNVGISFSQDDGFGVTVELRNFLVVEEETPPAPVADAPAQRRRRAESSEERPRTALEEQAAALDAELAELTAERERGEINDDEYAERGASLIRRSRVLQRSIGNGGT